MEEKQKLGLGLQSLPPKKMSRLVQIIRKRNDHLAQEAGSEYIQTVDVHCNKSYNLSSQMVDLSGEIPEESYLFYQLMRHRTQITEIPEISPDLKAVLFQEFGFFFQVY